MTTFARDMLRSFVERIENIEHEISERNDDKRDVYAEAKGSGFDVKALKAVIARRRKDVSEIEEHEAIVETYLAALASGTPVATRARARDAHPEPSSARQSTSSLPRGESEPAVTQACGRAEAITEFPDIPAGLRRTA